MAKLSDITDTDEEEVGADEEYCDTMLRHNIRTKHLLYN